MVDNVTLVVKAGDGGDGVVAFRPFKGGPDGGNGGNGGNIYIQGDNNSNDLRDFRFKKEIKAENGIPGKKKRLFGKNAPDLTIHVPLGTKVTDTHNGKVYEIVDSVRTLLIARGGKGGRGNAEFRTAVNQTPKYAEKGTLGQRKTIILELRLIAEIGLIGLPNAGKSSLLSVLTNASPKIGNYPFTTLEPNIGMLGNHAIADIPGLIEGASEGKGLGTKFLKHVEKTKILVHCIELSEDNAQERYQTVREELEQFNPTLAQKKELILLTKTDLVDEATIIKTQTFFKKMDKEVFTCSVNDPDSILKLKRTLEKLLDQPHETL